MRDVSPRRRERSSDRRRRVQNGILRALPPAEYRLLMSTSRVVPLPIGTILHVQHRELRHVYFPMSGVCSVVVVNEAGQRVEVGTVGCEGVTSAYTCCSAHPDLQMVVELGPADAVRVSLDAFTREIDRGGRLRSLVHDYHRAFIADLVQTAACNRLHSTRQRYCRRLLALADRLGSDTLVVTHTEMASMLATRRPFISAIATHLGRAGIIDHRRNSVEIVNRSRLESLACYCYIESRRRIDHLLPPGK
jgi:CRP-like cAMP-binding protein